jgi:anti-sigma regulatory factor (Ser/Thr protein kinase)
VVSRIVPPASEQGNHRRERDPGGAALPPRPESPARDAAIRFVVGADWVSPSLVRRRLRRWLGEQRWPQRRIDEMVLAVSEVVSNSVEHGYGISIDHRGPSPSVVEIDGTIEVDQAGFSRAVVVVTDHGVWQVPDPGPSSRGRGMLLARACTDQLSTEHRADGTTTIMHSRPIPPTLGS